MTPGSPVFGNVILAQIASQNSPNMETLSTIYELTTPPFIINYIEKNLKNATSLQSTDLHDPGRGPEHLRLLVLLLPLGPLHPLGQVVLGIAEPLYEDDRHRPDYVFNVLSSD